VPTTGSSDSLIIHTKKNRDEQHSYLFWVFRFFFSHFRKKYRADGYELLASCLRTHGERMFLKECAHDCNAAWIDCPNHSLKFVGSCGDERMI